MADGNDDTIPNGLLPCPGDGGDADATVMLNQDEHDEPTMVIGNRLRDSDDDVDQTAIVPRDGGDGVVATGDDTGDDDTVFATFASAPAAVAEEEEVMEIPPDLLADALRGTDDMAAVARSLATLLLRMGSRDGGLTRETADAVTDVLTPVATGAECGRAFVALTTAPVAQGPPAPSGNGAPDRDHDRYTVRAQGIETYAWANFTIGDTLGKGAMGAVYTATAAFGGVAIKVFPHFRSPADVDVFVREVQNVAKIQHPNCVNIYGITTDGPEGPGIVLELMDGPFRPLEHRKPRRTLTIVKQVTEGLAYIHENGLLHLDIKPANILIDAEGTTPKIADFGISVTHDEAAQGFIGGTPSYAAPEILMGDRGAVGPKTDIYSLGVMVFEAFAEERAFAGVSREDNVFATHAETPSYWPGSLVRLIDACMANETEARPTAAEMLAAIGEMMTEGMFDPMDCHDLGMFRAAVFWDVTLETEREHSDWRKFYELLDARRLACLCEIAIGHPHNVADILLLAASIVAKPGSAEFVRPLLDLLPQSVLDGSDNHMSLLCAMLRNSDDPAMLELVKETQDRFDWSIVTPRGHTPLAAAVMSSSIEAVKLVLSHPDAALNEWSMYSDGLSALAYAREKNLYDVHALLTATPGVALELVPEAIGAWDQSFQPAVGFHRAGNRLVVVGGEGAHSSVMQGRTYDIGTGDRESFPAPRWGESSYCQAGNFLVVYGGRETSTGRALSRFALIDMDTLETTYFSTARRDTIGSALAGDETGFYVFGGATVRKMGLSREEVVHPTHSLSYFAFDTQEWTELGSVASPRMWASAVLTPTALIIMGGMRLAPNEAMAAFNVNHVNADCYTIDRGTLELTELPRMPYPLCKFALVHQNGYLIAHGGMSSNSVGRFTRLLDLSNPEKGWIDGQEFGYFTSVPRFGAGVAVANRHWFCVGGRESLASRYSSVRSYSVPLPGCMCVASEGAVAEALATYAIIAPVAGPRYDLRYPRLRPFFEIVSELPPELVMQVACHHLEFDVMFNTSESEVSGQVIRLVVRMARDALRSLRCLTRTLVVAIAEHAYGDLDLIDRQTDQGAAVKEMMIEIHNGLTYWGGDTTTRVERVQTLTVAAAAGIDTLATFAEAGQAGEYLEGICAGLALRSMVVNALTESGVVLPTRAVSAVWCQDDGGRQVF